VITDHSLNAVVITVRHVLMNIGHIDLVFVLIGGGRREEVLC